MPTRKIRDLQPVKIAWHGSASATGVPCIDPDHNPPNPALPGVYQHRCPRCNKVTTFTAYADGVRL